MTQKSNSAGFTLLETLLSLALMTILIIMLSTLVRQWMIGWNLGAHHVETLEATELARDRIIRDIRSARFIPAPANAGSGYFIGEPTRLTFLRDASARDGVTGLVVVQYEIDNSSAVTRRIAPFDGVTPLLQSQFDPPVMLVAAPAQLEFSYLDETSKARSDWHERGNPQSVIFRLTNDATQSVPPSPIILRMELPATCAALSSLKECRERISSAKAGKPKDKIDNPFIPSIPPKVTP